MLAIVIPYYKKKYFRKTLDSLAYQTDKKFKVYIGDDNSPELPHDLINEYSNKLNLEYFRFDDNLGSISLVKQWNRCLEFVKNEQWVLILGDDDILEKNVVEEFYKNLKTIQELDIKVIRYSTVKIDEFGNKTSKLYINKKLETSLDFFFNKNRSSLSEYVFQKETLDAIGFKDLPLAWHSDQLAVMEISNFSLVYTINDATIKIRISKDSISGSETLYNNKLKASFKFYYYLIEKYFQKFNEHQLSILSNRLNKTYINSKFKIIRFILIIYLYFRKAMLSHIKLFFNQISRNILNKPLNA